VTADALASGWRDRDKGLSGYFPIARPPVNRDIDHADQDWLFNAPAPQAAATLRRIMDEESVVHLDDLLLRRTDWLADRRAETAVSDRARTLLNWKPPGAVNTAPRAPRKTST
jgi:hypothetical protein